MVVVQAMPMVLRLEMAAGNDVATEVMALVAVVLECLNSSETASCQDVHFDSSHIGLGYPKTKHAYTLTITCRLVQLSTIV